MHFAKTTILPLKVCYQFCSGTVLIQNSTSQLSQAVLEHPVIKFLTNMVSDLGKFISS